MKIYLLEKNYRFAELSPNNDLIDVINEGFNGVPMAKEWGKPQMVWNFEESKIKCDFPLLYGLIPVMSERAKNVLSLIVPPDSIEYLPIIVEDEIYYATNVLLSYDKILNIRKSKIDYFSDRTIMTIDKYVFSCVKNLSPMFKVSQLLVSTFVTADFKNIIENEKFTGINFKECKVVSKGWLGNIIN
jgi:hypothetical protein